MENLGIEMFYVVFMIEGRPDREEGARILEDAISWAKMHVVPDHHMAVWNYPTPSGHGGQGTTIIKPFTMIQPFVEACVYSHPMEESYANIFIPVGISAIDTYIEHNHFFMEIASCKKFRPYEVYEGLKDKGYRILGMNRMHIKEGTISEAMDFND